MKTSATTETKLRALRAFAEELFDGEARRIHANAISTEHYHDLLTQLAVQVLDQVLGSPTQGPSSRAWFVFVLAQSEREKFHEGLKQALFQRAIYCARFYTFDFETAAAAASGKEPHDAAKPS